MRRFKNSKFESAVLVTLKVCQDRKIGHALFNNISLMSKQKFSHMVCIPMYVFSHVLHRSEGVGF